MKRLGFGLVSLMSALAFAPLPAALTGCGHTDQEMADKQREIDALKVRIKAAEDRHAKDEQGFQDAQTQIDALKAKMREAGLAYEDKLGRSEKEKADLTQALEEYKQRAAQLDAMKKRFQDLRAKLSKITDAGLKVVVRNNRMVIELPGEILFRSGEANLEEKGKKVLKQIATIVGTDDTLRTRQFQVAGHTDDQEYGNGPFKDNWGLSLARARSVVVFLTSKDEAPKGQTKAPGSAYGGNLDPRNWSASGYGEWAPAVGTHGAETPDQRGQNRRVELVLQPNVEEMLNLKDFGDK